MKTHPITVTNALAKAQAELQAAMPILVSLQQAIASDDFSGLVLVDMALGRVIQAEHLLDGIQKAGGA